MPHVMTSSAAVMRSETTRWFFMRASRDLGQPHGVQQQVDQFDANERDDHPAEAVDQQIASKDAAGAERTISDPFQRQRNERDDDERVENHGRENGGLRRRQVR